MARKPDFSGWATRFNRKCSDGRTITPGAFKDCDGARVPLVWNHEHDDPAKVLGHADLSCRESGVWTDCYFNDTEAGQISNVLVHHGDIVGLSIYANHLKQDGGNVLHGKIREVSLVLAGANPGAYIEEVMAHSDEEDIAVFVNIEDDIELRHDDEDEEESSGRVSVIEHAEENKTDTEKEGQKEMADNKERTVQDVVDSMTEEQRNVMYALIGQALENQNAGGDDEDEDESEDKTVKHNVFDNDSRDTGNYLSHSDMQAIFSDAKRLGSLKEAVLQHCDGGVLMHDDEPATPTIFGAPLTGMDLHSGNQTYGFNDPSMLFPDAHNLNNTPEWIGRDTNWVSVLMNGVTKSPFSRIRSRFANITEDEARAKGYLKGNKKKTEVFTLLKRVTTPQTIYKLQQLDRDDIIDITDFDVVAWIKAEMRVMLDEEQARAILIGDGRLSDAEDKISEEHIRPIATDVPLFNITKTVTIDAEAAAEFGDETAYTAKQIIKDILRARKEYKGSGNPVFFTTEDWMTEMLLLEDGIGHRLYKTEAELATALRVSRIVTVEVMENQTIDSKELVGIVVNPKDYTVGADKKGQTSLFDDFDIDYNRYKYLIERRASGALTKPFSAITVLLASA